uniref:WAS/WASL-interacting protein family member 1 n=1 Tax=Rhizophora mucronata TaxID=61149 RepID=A0A2P2LVS0_RHIMU
MTALSASSVTALPFARPGIPLYISCYPLNHLLMMMRREDLFFVLAKGVCFAQIINATLLCLSVILC